MAEENAAMTDERSRSLHPEMASDGEPAEAGVTSKDERSTGSDCTMNDESTCSARSRSDEDVTRAALAVEADAFTRFIERQRIEVMFELRRLRFGERPVTGQSNRERIETFLTNIREQQQQDKRVPSRRPAVPSAHIADIDALASRRCVSATLSSPAFRRDLENAIRQSIGARPTTTVQTIPRAPPLPRTLAPVSATAHSYMGSVDREQEHSSTSPTQSHRQFNVERQERELHAWQTITQLQREIIVLEISDLVHRQLVTSALESDFRRHLEQNVLTRLDRGAPSQQDEPTVPHVVAPRTPSTPSATISHSSVAPSSIDTLSSRLDAMQHMLHLMFSMQIDMQRSLRHEVASALAGDTPTNITPASQTMNAGHCTVCLTAMADTVLYRCGHLCVCYLCGLNLRETHATAGVKCPICRAPVDDILRVYRSSRDGE